MKATRNIFVAAFGSLVLSGCLFGGSEEPASQRVVQDIAGGSNPYLWRASLDTFQNMPLVDADPIGGTIIYDWKSFPQAPNERIKATIYILDSRLRADGVKVSVFRQVKSGSEWVDSNVDVATGIQLENAILDRARNLKAAEIG